MMPVLVCESVLLTMQKFGCHLAKRRKGGIHCLLFSWEEWLSGLRYLTRNQAWGKLHRGFESHLFRQGTPSSGRPCLRSLGLGLAAIGQRAGASFESFADLGGP